ncbi:glycerophosphodiester phosphodiesterase family protein [uncultured Cohaesibacter sp.]|uniref:glycerophosphodiester phosphodiesterase n=1 Tax=uncultured Cohaesibacter sp. TaxID=1002546 RepID=UPI0029C6D8B8|nr:glycerophosphodiester phosphodiesterase family protein [uncultured Cohaesibacter sp.]
MKAPVSISRNGHRTLLKWHRARRFAQDTAFTGRRILECMQAGGSIEIDLQVNGDGTFVVLHDELLEQSTSGKGPVNKASAVQLAALFLKDDTGGNSGEKVMLLDDLAELVAQGAVGEGAVLQLDLKDGLDAFHDNTVASFADAIAPVAGHMILSGMHADAVLRLADALEGLPVGYDPCNEAAVRQTIATGVYQDFVERALATAPWASMIYLEHRFVLQADAAGFDMIGAFHEAGKLVDAWTLHAVTNETRPMIERLLALKVDQITTDDPEGFCAQIS